MHFLTTTIAIIPGIPSQEADEWLSTTRRLRVAHMEPATWNRCGGRKNAFVVLTDGKQMCARYRDHYQLVAGWCALNMKSVAQPVVRMSINLPLRVRSFLVMFKFKQESLSTQDIPIRRANQ